MVLAQNHIDDLLGHGWKDCHHERATDCADHRGHRHPRIAGRISENPKQNAHGLL